MNHKKVMIEERLLIELIDYLSTCKCPGFMGIKGHYKLINLRPKECTNVHYPNSMPVCKICWMDFISNWIEELRK